MKNKIQLLAEINEEIEAFGLDCIVYVWYEMQNPTTVVSTQADDNYLDNEALEDNIERKIIVYDYSDEPRGNCRGPMTLEEIRELVESM